MSIIFSTKNPRLKFRFRCKSMVINYLQFVNKAVNNYLFTTFNKN